MTEPAVPAPDPGDALWHYLRREGFHNLISEYCLQSLLVLLVAVLVFAVYVWVVWRHPLRLLRWTMLGWFAMPSLVACLFMILGVHNIVDILASSSGGDGLWIFARLGDAVALGWFGLAVSGLTCLSAIIVGHMLARLTPNHAVEGTGAHDSARPSP